ATFSLFSRLKSESRVTKRPSLNGFSVYDMIDPEVSRPTIQTIGGKSYNVHLIRQSQLFPLQAGTFTIDPVELDNTVRFVRAASGKAGPRTSVQQLMDDMMNDGLTGETEEHNFTLSSKPIVITVKPLPLENRPVGFNGAVGKFTATTVWKSRTVAAGDAFEMELTIKGEGNFSVINPPAVALPSSIDSYDPAIKEDVDKTHYPLSGSKTFSYTFLPRDTGHFTIPGLDFSYFDPSDQQYKTVSSEDVVINVTKGSKKSIFKRSPANASVNETSDAWEFFDEYKFVIFAGGALVALTIIGFYKRHKKKRRRARRAARVKQRLQPPVVTNANSVTERIAPHVLFDEARTALEKGNSKDFYAGVNRSIWQFIGERLHISSTDLNKSNVANMLSSRGVQSDKITDLQNLLNECEIAIYTPVHDAADMTKTLNKAEDLIASLRSSIS
ncbi:MAG: BatD family protein, partial [Chitinophagaceae bacterium]